MLATSLMLLCCVFTFVSCETESLDPALVDTTDNGSTVDPDILPVLNTKTITNIQTTGANSGGTITNDGGAPIIARGVVWNTSPNPTVAHSKTTDGAGIGAYNSTISGLTPNTLYYVRAYATNTNGTAYGNQVTVTTTGTAPSNFPVLTTLPITNNIYPGAASGGNITLDGGSPITARGVVWSTLANPTVPSTRKTVDGTGTGTFTSIITQLQVIPGSTVYLRAYATNANGTAYGNEIMFTVTPNQVDNSAAIMTANVNGVQYNLMQPYLYSYTGVDVRVENEGAGPGKPVYLKIQGDTSNVTGVTTEINLYIPDDKWHPGTYSLIETFDLMESRDCQAKLILPYIGGSPDLALVTGGSITITEFNYASRRIKGTFNMTYRTDNGNFQVTNGTFNYGLDDDYFD